MAGTGTKRITELTEASTIQSGDFIAVDSNARGTKKVSTDTLATSAALTAETNAREAADEQMSERMDGIEEQTALIQNPTKTLSGALCSFTDGANMPMVACTASIEPKQSGTGTPSPDNVRQISGWESVDVNVSGKNLLNIHSTGVQRLAENGITFTLNSDGTVTANGTATGTAQIYWNNIPSATYAETWSGKVLNGCPSISGCSLRIEKANSPWTNYATDTGNGATIGEIPSNVGELAIYCRVAQGTTLNNAVFKPMIRVSGASTEYEPYNGTTTPVNLGRTVYGGTLDVVSGVLTAYPFYPSYNGETLNGRWICDRAVYAEGTTPPTGSQVALISGTSTTYQLTPTEIQTLLGENNVWADSGDVAITYRRDISIVLENLENALNGSNSLNTMMMSAPTENTAEEPTEDEAEDDMR